MWNAVIHCTPEVWCAAHKWCFASITYWQTLTYCSLKLLAFVCLCCVHSRNTFSSVFSDGVCCSVFWQLSEKHKGWMKHIRDRMQILLREKYPFLVIRKKHFLHALVTCRSSVNIPTRSNEDWCIMWISLTTRVLLRVKMDQALYTGVDTNHTGFGRSSLAPKSAHNFLIT